MREIAAKEYEIVSGGLNPIGALMGGVAGSAIYGGTVIGSGSQPSIGEFLRAAGRGAFTGALVPSILPAGAAMATSAAMASMPPVPGQVGLGSKVLGVAMLGGVGGLAAGVFDRLA